MDIEQIFSLHPDWDRAIPKNTLYFFHSLSISYGRIKKGNSYVEDVKRWILIINSNNFGTIEYYLR